MAKKRRVTQEQAYLLAIGLIRDALVAANLTLDPGDAKIWAETRLGNYLPEKWFDGQTSGQSWEFTWQETTIQLSNVMECLVNEARRVQQENSGFRF